MVQAQRMAFVAALGLACLAGQPVRAQDAPTQGAPIPGYYDPATRTFTAIAASAEELDAGKAGGGKIQTIYGTVTIKAVVDVVSDIPSNATFRSTVMLKGGLLGSVNADEAVSSGQVTARPKVERKGSKATVTIKLPYHMGINGSVKTLTANVVLSADVADVPGIEFSKTFPVPKNGAKTTVALQGAL